MRKGLTPAPVRATREIWAAVQPLRLGMRAGAGAAFGAGERLRRAKSPGQQAGRGAGDREKGGSARGCRGETEGG